MTRISGRYLAKRLIHSYLTLLVIMTLLFLLVRAMPGSFIQGMVTPQMTGEQVTRLRHVWGLNEPLWQQYLDFMINYQTGNFGWSPNWNVPVWDLIARRLPRTLILFGGITIFGLMVGPLVGMYLGWHRGTRGDQSIFTASLFIYSIPVFWVAWLFIWLFTYYYEVLPAQYMRTQFPEYTINAANVTIDVLSHIALPLVSVGAVTWVASMLVMRTQMNTVANEGYVFLARAKGLSERTVMIKHAARNALIPVATSAIIAIVFIIDGSVIIENLFNYPGIGNLIFSAVLNRDYPTTQALFFVFAVLVIAARLLIDVVYTYLDPRIKFGEEA